MRYFWAEVPKGSMVPHREDLRLCYYVFTFFSPGGPPPLLDPSNTLAGLPDHLAGPQTLGQASQTLQLASQTLCLAS